MKYEERGLVTFMRRQFAIFLNCNNACKALSEGPTRLAKFRQEVSSNCLMSVL